MSPPYVHYGDARLTRERASNSTTLVFTACLGLVEIKKLDSGRVSHVFEEATCPACIRVVERQRADEVEHTLSMPTAKCPACDGTGEPPDPISKHYNGACDTCQGTGKVHEIDVAHLRLDGI